MNAIALIFLILLNLKVLVESQDYAEYARGGYGRRNKAAISNNNNKYKALH